MPTYPIRQIINNEPCFDVKVSEIYAKCLPGGALKVLSPLEAITDRQRRWFKGVAIPHMVKHDENGETAGWWDDELKRLCKGLDYLKKEIFFLESSEGQKIPIGRLTTVGVGKRNMTLFIEEIIAQSVARGWGLPAPDKELRKK